MCFHIRRNLNGNEPPITTTTVAIRPKRRTPCKQWMPAVFITILLCCLSLAHAVVTTDGYYKTCEQYRKRLIQVLGSTGHEAEVWTVMLSLNENLTKLTIRYVLYFYLFFSFLSPTYLTRNLLYVPSSFLQVVHNRLSCGAIFDFMDYLQTDVTNWNRVKEIDTGLALLLAIISTWFNFFAWTFAFFLNVIMARKRFCCC